MEIFHVQEEKKNHSTRVCLHSSELIGQIRPDVAPERITQHEQISIKSEAVFFGGGRRVRL